MTRFMLRRPRLALATAALLLATLPALSGQTAVQPMLLRGTSEVTVDDNGDAHLDIAIVFPTSLAYQETKLRYPNPYSLLRFILGADNRAVLRDTQVRYDDMARAVRTTCRRIGMASSRNGKWRLAMDGKPELIHTEDGLAIFYENAISPPNSIATIAMKIHLPEGARDLAYDARAREFSYRFARTPARNGDGHLVATVTAKENIMSATYKMYGDKNIADGTMWASKALLTNEGDADVTDVRIRHRIGEFADWSPEIRFDLVPPGGTLVDCYYPVFKTNAMELVNPSPVYIDMEFSWLDTDGRRHEDTASVRTRILGRTSFLYSNLPNSEAVSWIDRFSNAPFLAGFVTSMDPVVREFAGLASQASGGAAAQTNDDAALAFCKAVYDQMVANGISYQSPPSFLTETANLVQELKYPRDVLRDKAGTCIELAILYAAVCESNGLKTALVLIPGHCFSVVELPSGRLLPVENTTVQGAAVGKSGSFDQAVEIARKEMAELKPELFYMVNVRALQEMGIVSPELPELPPDTLGKWGFELRLPAKGATPTAPAANRGPDNQADAGPLAGHWRLSGVNKSSGQPVTIEIVIEHGSGGYAGRVAFVENDYIDFDEIAFDGSVAVAKSTFMARGAGQVALVIQGEIADGVWNCEYVLTDPDGKRLGFGPLSGRKKDAEEAGQPEPPQPAEDVSLAGTWEGRYSAADGEYRIKFEINRRHGGKMHLLDKGVTAKILHIKRHGAGFNLGATWSAHDDRGREVPMVALFLGELKDGKWIGGYAIGVGGSNTPTGKGLFSVAMSEPAAQESALKWSDIPRTPAEGHLTGSWSGVYIDSLDNRFDLTVEVWQSGDKYRGSLGIPSRNLDAPLQFISDTAGFGLAVAEWGDNVISLTGEIKGDSWSGEVHLSGPSVGDTGTFRLQK